VQNTKMHQVSDDELIACFISESKQMGTAVLSHETRKANRIFQHMWDIDLELRARGGEARLKLAPLLDNNDRFVLYYAAKKLLSLVPDRARAVIEDVANPIYDALSFDAGMCLYALDEGIFRPD
jgi:Domain of unknown function (DUF2019)